MVVVALAIPPVASGDTRLPPEDVAQPLDICQAVADENVIDPSIGWIRPSPDYGDGNWLRDTFWTTGFLGPTVGRMALDSFGAHLSPEGQAPTRLGTNGVPDEYHEDESTLLYLIWAARDGGQPRERIERAWNWISRHVSVDGGYWTPPGNYRTWHDTLVFPTWDVATYNQGLYAAATLAGSDLGLVGMAEVAAAAAFYRKLYRPAAGYLPVSLGLDYYDPSTLVGEVLARTLFGRPRLDDQMVVSTVRALPRIGPSFVALFGRDWRYLPEAAFSPPSVKGHYQNGGSWLLYDVLAWTAASMAGASEARILAQRRLALEVATGTLYEFLPTGPAKVMGANPDRSDYAWNAYACVALGLSDGRRQTRVGGSGPP